MDPVWTGVGAGAMPDPGGRESVTGLATSIPYLERADDAVLDQADEVIRAAVEPAEVLAAFGALAVRPCVTREPRMFQGWVSGLPATMRLGKDEDLETHPLRVVERELVLAFVPKAIQLVCHPIVTPGAEPVARRIGGSRKESGLGTGLHQAGRQTGFP
jgi:hypothetical protein